MALPSNSLPFKVYKCEPELIKPAKPTPHEFKQLSDIDDQEGLRFQIPVIQFYRNNPFMQGKDPVMVIREALAKTLVVYYPFAGRLREVSNRKLMVECTGEGILFIQADADVTIEHFGDALQPPFPLEELVFDFPGSSEILNCPLLLVQVTQLRCGGFIFAIRVNHTMSDGPGLVQFLTAVGEMARGASAPSIPPVWERNVLNASDPPCVTCRHREYEEVADTGSTIIPLDDHLVHRSFFFGQSEVSALRKLVPPHLRQCTSFEIVTACIWKCRTISLQPDPNEEMRMMCLVNARQKINPPILPVGYYGNGFVYPAAVATAGELSRNPLSYALELVKKAKAEVTEEYVRSVASLMVIKGRPHFTTAGTYIVSDNRHAGFNKVDFGWGNAIYTRIAGGGAGVVDRMIGFYVAYRNKKGENGSLLQFCLPAPAMKRFVKELEGMLKGHAINGEASSKLKQSAL